MRGPRAASRTLHLLAVAATVAALGLLAPAADARTAARTGPAAVSWTPPVVARWQYQLTGDPAFAATGGIEVGICSVPYTGGACVTPDVYDIDLYVDQAVSGDNSTVDTAAVNAIHAAGGHAICYLDAGTWEDWRPDAGEFPDSVKGNKNGWPGERWLDIRATSVLLPIMSARVQRCADAGFDAVEWDNVDGYTNRTGFPLTAADQLAYNQALAQLAHDHGLAVGLKNDLEQAADLEPSFDFAINEQCQQYSECASLAPFKNAGKAIFQVEYKLATRKFCPQANAADRNAILKDLDLHDTPWTPCR